MPFAPEGWEAPLAVSEAPSPFLEIPPPGGGQFETETEFFVHWAVKNASQAAFGQQFHVGISVDGQIVHTFPIQGLGAQEIARQLNVPLTIDEPGAHTVDLTVDFLNRVGESSEGDNIFSTIVFVQAAQPTPTPTPLPVFDAHGDTRATASFIEPGQTPGGINPASDLDFFRFSAVASVQYTIEVHLATHPDTVVILYWPDGVFIDENDDAEGLGAGSRITWTAPVAGDFFIEVRSFNQTSDTGFYNLVLKGGSAPTPTPTPTPSTGLRIAVECASGSENCEVSSESGFVIRDILQKRGHGATRSLTAPI